MKKFTFSIYLLAAIFLFTSNLHASDTPIKAYRSFNFYDSAEEVRTKIEDDDLILSTSELYLEIFKPLLKQSVEEGDMEEENFKLANAAMALSQQENKDKPLNKITFFTTLRSSWEDYREQIENEKEAANLNFSAYEIKFDFFQDKLYRITLNGSNHKKTDNEEIQEFQKEIGYIKDLIASQNGQPDTFNKLDISKIETAEFDIIYEWELNDGKRSIQVGGIQKIKDDDEANTSYKVLNPEIRILHPKLSEEKTTVEKERSKKQQESISEGF